jgi:predicted nucleotide-binding protein (sugar kinase/HSP70/actin superfamily)
MTTDFPQKTIYIPYMADHCYILAAAIAANGQPAEVLPLPTDETMAIGLSFCRGRECSPCLTVSGDVVLLTRRSDFDPARAALFVPTTTGSCRFGQYTVLMRQILDQLGLQEIAIIGPSANNSYQDLGDDPVRLRRLLWEGMVAVDLIQKLRHRYRPYETTVGATDMIYQTCLDRVVTATKSGGGKALVRAMQFAAAQFTGLPDGQGQRRPLIGMVGEIYLRHNTVTNLNMIRRIEALGGEVDLATMMEWIYYTNWGHSAETWLLGQPVAWFQSVITDRYQRYLERKLVGPVAHLLDHPYEPPVGRLMQHIRPYFSPTLANECLLSMGKMVELSRLGVCGMINVMPFSCMPGIITAGMAPRLRTDLDNLPWLDIAFDAQGGTNITTRLEAFMHQATGFQRRLTNGNRS